MKKFLFGKRIIGLLFLYYLCRMGAETYDGIMEKSGNRSGKFRGTFLRSDLWCENCFWNMESMELMNTTGFSAI